MTYKLQEICTLVNEKISINDIMNSDFYISTENMLPDKGGVTSPSSLPSDVKVTAYKRNDVLISNIRPYFKKIWFAVNDGGCSNDVLVFRAKKGISPNFLHYVLADDAFFEYAMKTSKGTKMPRGDKKAIMEYEILMFDLENQQKISSILSALDGKIELNNRINENLEQQAQAIFKSWFVDFEPFGGVMPEDWKIGKISDLSREIICGKTPSTKKKENYGDYMPFITILDMHNCVYTISTERYLSKLGVDSQIKKTLPKNSICVSCIGTAGLVTLVPSNSQTNQQINSIIPKEHYSPYYIYLLMRTFSEKINRLGQSGSTIVNLNKAQFGIMEALIPSIDSMIKFDNIVKPLFEKILSNQIENQKLSALRDPLLPKLMNGEIDVENVEI